MEPRWVIIEDISPPNRRRLLARCSGCGLEKEINRRDLDYGKTRCCKSCGRNRDGRRGTPEYAAWRWMKQRCASDVHPSADRYRGRGIAVCERWANSFPAFLADMGRKPSTEHSIDRIDNDRGYEPGNCRWATRDEQAQNTAATKLTVSIVQEIRGRVEHGESQASVGRRMNLTASHVHAVVSRLLWRNVP